MEVWLWGGVVGGKSSSKGGGKEGEGDSEGC